jgi:hypothetical protein
VPDAQSQIDHELFSGDNLCALRKSPQVMACVAVVVFNINCMCFADYMPLRRQYFRESFPIVGVKSSASQINSKYSSHHLKRTFRHCIKQNAECFLCCYTFVRSIVALSKITSAFLAPISLLPSNHTIFYRSF